VTNDEQTSRSGRHRRNLIWIGASAALVAIVLVVTALFATGAFARPETAATPTSTPTPAATSTPAETAAPADEREPVVAFGGECANVMTEAEASAITGRDMVLSEFAWRDGAETVLGGIDCMWTSTTEYMTGIVRVIAYPLAVVPAEVDESLTLGCVPSGPDDSLLDCAARTVAGDTWVFMTTRGDAAIGDVDALLATVGLRADALPSAVPAGRTPDWWTVPDCAALASEVDPSVVGHDRIEPWPDGMTRMSSPPTPYSIPWMTGSARECALLLTSDSHQWGIRMRFVPGGGVEFPSVLGAEGLRHIAQDGSVQIVIVPGNGRLEGEPGRIVVSDGTNLLALIDEIADDHDPEDFVPLVTELLAAVNIGR